MIEKLDECQRCGTVLSYVWETDTCKDCIERHGPQLTVLSGGKTSQGILKDFKKVDGQWVRR